MHFAVIVPATPVRAHLGSRPTFLSADDAAAFDRGYRAGEDAEHHAGPLTPFMQGHAEGVNAWLLADRAYGKAWNAKVDAGREALA